MGQRGVFFNLAAEIQRRLLPPSFTCEAAQFTVAGWLEPARSAAGDTFATLPHTSGDRPSGLWPPAVHGRNTPPS